MAICPRCQTEKSGIHTCNAVDGWAPRMWTFVVAPSFREARLLAKGFSGNVKSFGYHGAMTGLPASRIVVYINGSEEDMTDDLRHWVDVTLKIRLGNNDSEIEYRSL